jgi:hypothetical protein
LVLDGLPDSNETRVDISKFFLELLVFFFGPCGHALTEGFAFDGISDDVYFFGDFILEDAELVLGLSFSL